MAGYPQARIPRSRMVRTFPFVREASEPPDPAPAPALTSGPAASHPRGYPWATPPRRPAAPSRPASAPPPAAMVSATAPAPAPQPAPPSPWAPPPSTAPHLEPGFPLPDGAPLSWADVVPGWADAAPGWPHDAQGWPDDITLPDPPEPTASPDLSHLAFHPPWTAEDTRTPSWDTPAPHPRPTDPAAYSYSEPYPPTPYADPVPAAPAAHADWAAAHPSPGDAETATPFYRHRDAAPPGGIAPPGVSTAEIDPTETTPTEIDPNETNPSGPDPDEIGADEIYSDEYGGWGERSSGLTRPPALSTAGAFAGDLRSRLSSFDPGRRGVQALLAVAAAVTVLAAYLAWHSRPRVEPVPPPLAPTASQAPAPVRVSASPSEVVVAVAGKVRQPGLVRLTPGSRVADALTAAGGAQPGVDVAPLNLARKVIDGELITVGVTPSPGAVPSIPPNAAGALPPNAPAAGPPQPGAPVNLNTATLADLDSLPGVGEVLAQRILDARTAQGGFTAVTDLKKVDGIGPSRYDQLKDLVTV
jgi:competence protein ComEA